MNIPFLVTILPLISHAAMGELKMNADRMTNDKQTKTITLSGHARLAQGIYKLEADEILVNSQLGQVVASGHCQYQGAKCTPSDAKIRFKIENGQWTVIEHE